MLWHWLSTLKETCQVLTTCPAVQGELHLCTDQAWSCLHYESWQAPGPWWSAAGQISFYSNSYSQSVSSLVTLHCLLSLILSSNDIYQQDKLLQRLGKSTASARGMCERETVMLLKALLCHNEASFLSRWDSRTRQRICWAILSAKEGLIRDVVKA